MTDTAAPRLTEAVAGYALGHLGALDDQVTELVKRTLIDTLGVALAARQEPPVQILAVTLGALPAGRSTIWATGETTDAPTAALLNGTAGHALDFDDVTDVVYGHPSVVLWPAIFAAAEQEGSDGRSAVEASRGRLRRAGRDRPAPWMSATHYGARLALDRDDRHPSAQRRP